MFCWESNDADCSAHRVDWRARAAAAEQAWAPLKVVLGQIAATVLEGEGKAVPADPLDCAKVLQTEVEALKKRFSEFASGLWNELRGMTIEKIVAERDELRVSYESAQRACKAQHETNERLAEECSRLRTRAQADEADIKVVRRSREDHFKAYADATARVGQLLEVLKEHVASVAQEECECRQCSEARALLERARARLLEPL